jgi:predicted permease
MLGHLISDMRLGVRRLNRAPAATLTVVMALSVGIGLSAMMFSLIDGALLPTLPFENGERVVQVPGSFSADTYDYWRGRQRSFVGLGAIVERQVTLAIEGAGAEPARSAAMETTALSLLSVEPMLGRGFTAADAAPGAARVVLVGYETWQSRLGADPGALGRTVRVNGQPAEIIGVMPEKFGFPWSQELWTPLRLDALRPELNPDFFVFGLLRDGVSREAAAADLTALIAEQPRPAADQAPETVGVAAFTDIIYPPGRSSLLGGVMLGVAVLVLLVACANGTNVLLAQGAVRVREVALRACLGASRARILAQLSVEVSLLALVSAAGGALLAGVGVRQVRNAIPAGAGGPFWVDPRMDLRALAFVAIAAVAAAMVAGVMPALQTLRAGHAELLKDASRGTSSRRLGRTMGWLIGVELAVSFVLLVAAGLFVRSAINLQRFDFPFAPERVFTTYLQLPDERYEDVGDRIAFLDRLGETLAGMPGAAAAAAATALPGVGARQRSVAIEDVHAPADPDLPRTRYAAVTPTYFETFGAALLSGRAFNSGDGRDGPPVAIVNVSFQRRHLPRGAVGHRVVLPTDDGEGEWRTIVGVAPDLLAGGVGGDLQQAVYVPLAQDVPMAFQVAARARTDATSLATPLRDAVAEADRDVALSYLRTLDESIDLANASYGWLSALFLVAGGLALLLAGIGLYGVMAFWVTQRTREIGLRMAVGGARTTIVWFVVRQGMSRIAVGLLAGVLLAIPVALVLESALLGVRPFDPLVFGAVSVALLGAGFLGCSLPAVRATHVDPQSALTAE